MNFGFKSFIKDTFSAGSAILNFTRTGLELWYEGLFGEGFDWDTYWQLWEDLGVVIDNQDAALRMAAYISALTALIMQPQITAGVIAAIDGNEKLSRLVSAADKIDEVVQRAEGLVEASEDVIDKILNMEIVQESLVVIKRLHEVALLVDEDYQIFIDSLYDETANISRQVFGDVNTIASALTLINMARADAGLDVYQSPEEMERSWLIAAERLTKNVSANARKYARNPALFWSNLHREYIEPSMISYAEREEKALVERGRVASELITLSGKIVDTNTRFRNYVEAADPLLTKENRRKINRVIDNFDLDVITPLKELTDWVEKTYPEREAEIVEQVKDMEKVTAQVALINTVVGDPPELTDIERLYQRNRMQRILGSAWEIPQNTTSLNAEAEALTRDMFRFPELR